MDLVDVSVPASTQYLGNEIINIPAGNRFEIAHWDPGKIIDLNATVPVGKSWKVKIHLEIIESDA